MKGPASVHATGRYHSIGPVMLLTLLLFLELASQVCQIDEAEVALLCLMAIYGDIEDPSSDGSIPAVHIRRLARRRHGM